jgi:hypothetical protein
MIPAVHLVSQLLLVCLLWPQALAAQSPATVSIRCRIVDDISGEAVPKVRLALSGAGFKDPITTDTGSDGVGSFKDLPLGRYVLTFDKSGYSYSGAGSPGPKGSLSVDAISPPEVDLGAIVMVKFRNITGTVLWENDEPADRVIVHALLVKRGKTTFVPGDVLVAPTNDKGEFRLDRLKPGRYVVYAYVPGLAVALFKPRTALPVFYPGSPLPDVASSIDLRKSPDASHLVIHLKESTGVAVEGTVAASDVFPKGSGLYLGITIAGSPAQAIAGVEAKAGEAFRIAAVPPGSYRLVAVPKGRDFPNLRSFQPLHVGTEPLDGVTVTLSPRPPITGKAEVQRTQSKDGVAGLAPAANVELYAQSEELQIYGAIHQISNASGDFHLDDAVDGEKYMLNVYRQPGMYVARVEQNGRELPGGPFPIVGGGGSVRILFKDDGGSVQGTVRKKAGMSGDGFVVLAPADRTSEHLFRTAVPAKDGSFQLRDIAPGEYELLAFDRNDEDLYFEDSYLRGFASQAPKITVGPKAAQSVDLDMIDTTPRGR